MHGYLETWALARSRWKKRIVAKLFQDRDLREAACIHVNTESEMHSVRHYGLQNPVAIIPNGVSIDHRPTPKDEFLKRHPALNGRRLCLFLSRLHEKKGLGHLVDAWAQVAPSLPDWHLVIAGPDDGYLDVLRGKMARLQLGRVTITGPLYGTEKRAAQAASELFVLPSYSEGFSMAILEAMAAGLPVMITPGCHFPEVSQRGAGIEVEPTVAGTAEGLRRLCSQPPDVLSAMGKSGRRLVLDAYSWDTVAAKLAQVYEWVVGSDPAPEFVHFA
jgi:glycosyltransferase involved in cell wall biosynthesis